MKIVVASKNPVKINAVRIGFKKAFSDVELEVVGVSVDSGVSDQPMTGKETYEGALNRANNASIEILDADYYVGIEGGIEKFDSEYESFAWVVIKSGEDGRIGRGKTSSFMLPKNFGDLIDKGVEMGHAHDQLYNTENSKQKQGTVGLLTNNLITRTDYYIEPIIMALAPFLNKQYYEEQIIKNKT